MDDVLDRSALDQAALLRRGEVSCEALTRACLERVDVRDRHVAAFVEVAPSAALRTARALDRARRRDPDALRSPLWGLPTGLKDLHLTRGLGARMGSRAFRYLRSPIDDVTSATLRRAGLVILGKLGTSELGILPIVETALHPPVRNPWDPERTAGGSSGGSAAAIAAGLIPLAPASDGAGSIRIPASFCGLVGHKPSRGLVPNPHAPKEPLGLSVIGPHARSVEDAAALLDLLVGREHLPSSFLAALRRAPSRLAVRFATDNPVVDTDPAIAAAVVRVAAALADLGHDVDEGRPLTGDPATFVRLYQWTTTGAPVIAERILQPVSRWMRAQGRRVSRAEAAAIRDDWTRVALGWFAGVDVWVTPTVAVPPPEVGAWSSLPPDAAFDHASKLGAFTAVFNASGMPAVTIPVRVDGHRWPIGVQLVGRHGDDARLLALARAVLPLVGTPLQLPALPR